MVWVFKTSVKTKSQVEALSPLLNEITNGSWNFDLEDCDHILRIHDDQLIKTELISSLQKEGVDCEELAD